jgi:hypothetical protein
MGGCGAHGSRVVRRGPLPGGCLSYFALPVTFLGRCGIQRLRFCVVIKTQCCLLVLFALITHTEWNCFKRTASRGLWIHAPDSTKPLETDDDYGVNLRLRRKCVVRFFL